MWNWPASLINFPGGVRESWLKLTPLSFYLFSLPKQTDGDEFYILSNIHQLQAAFFPLFYFLNLGSIDPIMETGSTRKHLAHTSLQHRKLYKYI